MLGDYVSRVCRSLGYNFIDVVFGLKAPLTSCLLPLQSSYVCHDLIYFALMRLGSECAIIYSR